MFLRINNVLSLAVSAMEIGAKRYKDTFVHFQITGNQQAEEKAQHLQYLEILVLNKKLKLS